MCRDLGIDDPVAWFQAVPEAVLDGWVAFYSLEADEINGDSGSKMVDPLKAMQMLQERLKPNGYR